MSSRLGRQSGVKHALRHLDDAQVGNAERRKNRKKYTRWRPEAEVMPPCGEWKDQRCEHDAQRRCGEGGVRSARERTTARANDEYHQHLSRQRYDEPARLEQRLFG